MHQLKAKKALHKIRLVLEGDTDAISADQLHKLVCEALEDPRETVCLNCEGVFTRSEQPDFCDDCGAEKDPDDRAGLRRVDYART
jgi:hypothetical protein